MMERGVVGVGVGRLIVALFTLLLGAGSVASAQCRLVAVDGGSPGGQLGRSLASVGDLNGDGVPDFAAGSPLVSWPFYNEGEVRAFSGVDGSLLLTIGGSSSSEELGFALAEMGDVDLDGYPDLLAGAPFWDFPSMLDVGAARVYSGATGESLMQAVGSASARAFGFSVDCAGDLNVDGVPDFVVGAPALSGGARVVSGADGTTLYELAGDSFEYHGTAVSGGSDVDGDGIPDLLVTAPLMSSATSSYGPPGGVRVYSGTDGSVLMKLVVPESHGPSGYFGKFLADMDMDGRAEIALGSVSPTAVVFSGGTGQIIHSFQDAGFHIESCGDQNLDGVEDFVLGAPAWASSAGPVGLARVVSGADGSVLSEIAGDAPGDYFGYAVLGIPDINGDSVPDLLFGAPLADGNGQSSGRAIVVSLPQEQEVSFAPFVLGDRVLGTTDALQKAHGFSFAGLGFTVIELDVQSSGMSAIGEDLVVSVRNKAGGTDVVLPKVQGGLKYTLPAHGEYELRVEGLGCDSYGTYALKSGRKLPEFAKSKKWKLIAKPAHYIPFSALPGATVTIVTKSAWKKSQYEVALLDPDGSPVDLSSGVLNGKGVYKAKDIALDKLGLYQLRASGFQFSKEKLTIKIKLDQPPKGKGTVVWSE